MLRTAGEATFGMDLALKDLAGKKFPALKDHLSHVEQLPGANASATPWSVGRRRRRGSWLGY
jgi:hypothetical protein